MSRDRIRGESLRSRSRVAAQRLSFRTPAILASGLLFVGLAISLGPSKPDFHIAWEPTIEIPAFGDFDQQFAPKYLLQRSITVDAAPLPTPAPPPAAAPVAVQAAPTPPAPAPSPAAATQLMAAQFAGTAPTPATSA